MEGFKVYMGRRIPSNIFMKLSDLNNVNDDNNFKGNEIKKNISWLLKVYPGYAVVVDESINKVVAYASLVSLNDEAYQKALDGSLIGANLTSKDIVPFKAKRNHHLFLYNVALDKNYHGTMLMANLIYGIFNNFIILANHNVYALDLLADSDNIDVNSLIKVLGMKYIKTSNHDSFIHQSTFYPFTFKLPHAIKDILIPIYDKKFGDYRKVSKR